MSAIIDFVAGRKASRREDVVFDPGGLPPCVSGAVRAFLSVSVERIVWTADVDAPTRVRLKWWGQQNGGNVFRSALLFIDFCLFTWES